MTSAIKKHSIIINSHKTSISLEDQFWNGLKEIADAKRATLSDLVGTIATAHEGNLSSAVRLFVFSYYRSPPQISA